MEASATGIIGGTFSIVKERFGPMLGLIAIYFVIQFMILLIMSVSIGASFALAFSMNQPGAMGAGSFLMIAVFYLVIFAIYGAQTASLTAMASPLQRLTFGDALNVGFRCVPTMLGVFVILMVAYFILAFALTLVLGGLMMASKWLAILAGVALVPAGIYLASRLSVINAVVAVDRETNPITAINRGWNLTRGHAMTIVLALVLFILIAAVGMAIVIAPSFSTIMAGSSGNMTTTGFAGMGATMVLGLIFAVVFGLAGAALVSVIHAELAGTLDQDVEVFA